MKNKKRNFFKNNFFFKVLNDEEGKARKIIVNVLCIALIAVSFIGAAKGIGFMDTIDFIANK